ncbi:hypothetical protein [Jidongwangia harbinensis]|uniref:hypothetical protein n=1 Tax=Jidongwangia harbinensis TaxID=2878561 RepID=UPI001CD9315A|nr:hypothetical protein [Jidongwangia harbinensis]MCA2211683.1 hypothetical protein [Jidongwangia harbinensis]
MIVRARLTPGITFHEMPFCGVLLDTRVNVVFRLSPELAGILRRALHGRPAVGPYESLTGLEPESGRDEMAALRPLAERGLIQPVTGTREGRDDGR